MGSATPAAAVTSVKRQRVRWGIVSGEGAVVAEEAVGRVVEGDVEVGAAVVVEVAAGDGFDEAGSARPLAGAMSVKVPSRLLWKSCEGWGSPGVDSCGTKRSS